MSQLWQEISEENRQVQDIMSTLENFQLDTTPAKPSNHDDCEVRPVHMEQRYGCWLFTFSFSFSTFSVIALLCHCRTFAVHSFVITGCINCLPVNNSLM